MPAWFKTQHDKDVQAHDDNNSLIPSVFERTAKEIEVGSPCASSCLLLSSAIIVRPDTISCFC